jgi:hypothetical protein
MGEEQGRLMIAGLRIHRHYLWLVAVVAIASTSTGCSSVQGSAVRGGVVQAYAGPERPPQEVGTIALANSQIFVEVVGVDGEAVGDARAIRVLPGESRIEVRCVRWQPRDPFGSWRGREVLQVEIEAGGHYRLSTWTLHQQSGGERLETGGQQRRGGAGVMSRR